MSRTSFRLNPHFIICLNVKELLARSRCQNWSLSEGNAIWTHNHLVCMWTLNHLAKLTKWLSFVVSTYLYGAFDIQANYRVWIHSETRTWRDNKIQSDALYRKHLQHSYIIWAFWLDGWSVPLRTNWLWIQLALLSSVIVC